MFENVKNLVSKKFINDFNDLIDVLNELGFNTYWKVINGKDCGVPQTRERVFVIAIRKDIDSGKYEFPKPFDNGLRLRDILESEVAEKYYLSDDKVASMINLPNRKSTLLLKNQATEVTKQTEYANTLLARDYKGFGNQEMNAVCELQQIGYINNYNGDANRVYDDNLARTLKSEAGGGGAKTGWYLTDTKLNHHELPCFYDDRDKGWGVKTSDICPTQRAERNGIKCVEPNRRVRRLVPKECWKLMGFKSEDCEAASDVGIADTHLYKQAGNSIITNCVKLLAEHLYKAQYDNTYKCSDENFTRPQVD